MEFTDGAFYLKFTNGGGGVNKSSHIRVKLVVIGLMLLWLVTSQISTSFLSFTDITQGEWQQGLFADRNLSFKANVTSEVWNNFEVLTTGNRSSEDLSRNIAAVNDDVGTVSNSTTNTEDITLSTAEVSNRVKESMEPWRDVKTLSYFYGKFFAGYRNQMLSFLMILLMAVEEGCGQILVDSLRMKDTFGTNQPIQFDELYDIPYWNSFYPQLPRLVRSDPILHPSFNPGNRQPYVIKSCPFNRKGERHSCIRELQKGDGISWDDLPEDVQSKLAFAKENITTGALPTINSPIYFGIQNHLILQFKRYTKQRTLFKKEMPFPIHPAEILSQKALRPHPDLQEIIDNIKREMEQKALIASKGSNKSANNAGERMPYMTVHARIEPDMQKHNACPSLKVLELADIVSSIETQLNSTNNIQQLPSYIFLPMNREILEMERKNDPNNTIAMKNLEELDRILTHGILNGTIPVYHGYSNVLKGTRYANRPSTTQALISYHIALDSDIFVGTPVSSYSHALTTSRFHRDQRENYMYSPQGIELWTKPNDDLPPEFDC